MDYPGYKRGVSQKMYCWASEHDHGDRILVQYYGNEICDGKITGEHHQFGCRRSPDKSSKKYVKYKCHAYHRGDGDLRAISDDKNKTNNLEMDVILVASVPIVCIVGAIVGYFLYRRRNKYTETKL